MKNLFKFTTAALALVAFASCSNEDLFSSANDQLQQDKNGILVEVEDLIDANTTLTRASYTPALVDGKKQGVLNWNTTDIIRVTDATMVKYDKYGYNGSAFAFDATATGRSSAKVTEPKYASYPDANMVWDNADWEATGQYVINPAASWAEDLENDGAFVAELPLWGTAETDATYGIKTSLKYLTGVLRINLENLPGNATNVRVEGWKNLAGTQEAPMASDVTSTNPYYFEAVYATDDELDENATLVPVDGNDYVNYIDVDVTGATLSESTIFLPLIVQKYGLLRISYSNDNGTTYTKFKDIENLNVARRTWYNFTPADQFEVSGVYPSDITAVLAEKAAQSEISIKTGKTTQVVTSDQTITIPETSADITLDLLELKAVSETALYIDAAGDYAGTLTLNVATTDLSNVFINLPSATVVVNKLGATATTDLGKAQTGYTNVPEGLIAKCLVIGEDAKIKAIWPNAELGIGNDANPDVKMMKGSEVGTLRFETNYKANEIEINGTLTNALKMNDLKDSDGNLIPDVKVTVGNGASVPQIKTTGDVTVTGGTVAGFVTTDGNVTISGVTNAAAGTTAGSVGGIAPLTAGTTTQITNTITLSEEGTVQLINEITKHNFALTVKDKATVTGTATVQTLTIDGTTASVKNVTVAGDVTITDTEEVEAISGTLTMAASKTLNLNGGYIQKLDITAASSAATAVTIAHGTAANYTAIGTLTGSNYVFSGKSVWNGKMMKSSFSGYNTGKVYTAIQLASLPASTTSVEVYSNIDLNNQNWSGTGFSGSSFAFAGKDINAKTSGNQYPTIENLNLYAVNNSNVTVTGLGFIKSATSATLSNFTLRTVSTSFKSNKTVTGVGALIGCVITGATIDGVTVNGAQIGSTAYCQEVGGLVGNSTGTISLKSVTATGLTLNGENTIGGVVGKTTNSVAPVQVTANSTINVTAINVPEDHKAAPDITKIGEKEIKYGAVGMIAGDAKAKVTIDTGKTLTVNDLITGHRQEMGYTWYWENAGSNLRYYHGLNGDKNKSVKDWVWVGLRSDLSSTTPIATTAEFQETYGVTEKVLMVKHDIYSSCDE